MGWTTDHLVLPSFEGGDVAASTWWLSVAAILGVSAVRCSTIWVRGVATGRVQHRAQAATRRAVVRRYLHLDLDDGSTAVVEVSPDLHLPAGASVGLTVKPGAAHLFGSADQQRIAA